MSAEAPRADQPRDHLELNDPSSLEVLERSQQLRSLTLYYFPKIHQLDPIGRLVQLRRLHLSTPPSYDASRKVHHVESLAPLAELVNLESLVTRGVEPGRDRLRPLHALHQLKTIAITHVYCFSIDDYARLAGALPDARGHCLVPYYDAPWAGKCKTCGTPRIALTGPPPRTPRTLCPICKRNRLDEHVSAWNAILQRG